MFGGIQFVSYRAGHLVEAVGGGDGEIVGCLGLAVQGLGNGDDPTQRMDEEGAVVVTSWGKRPLKISSAENGLLPLGLHPFGLLPILPALN